ncbi:MAG: hypothetical protein ACRCSG_08490, partial [Cellulosilyticaceae bacterium]
SYGMNMCGDEFDAFDVGDEIGLSGIIPAANYPTYNVKEEKLNPFIVNGITIKILSVDANGTYKLDIRFDDYEVRKSQRWCGNLLLPTGDLKSPNILNLKKNVILTLDLSGTVDRITKNPLSNTFSNITHLLIEAGNTVRVEKSAKLIVSEYSKLELSGNALIVIEKGGELRIENSAELIMNPNTRILIKKGGKLVVLADARFKQLDGSYLGIEKGAKVKM